MEGFVPTRPSPHHPKGIRSLHHPKDPFDKIVLYQFWLTDVKFFQKRLRGQYIVTLKGNAATKNKQNFFGQKPSKKSPKRRFGLLCKNYDNSFDEVVWQ